MKWIICTKYLHPGEDRVSFIIWDKKKSYYSLFGRDILLIMSYVFYYRCVLLGNSLLSSFINFRSSVGRTYALLCIVQWWRLICIPTTCYTFFTAHFFKRFVRQDFTRNLRRSPYYSNFTFPQLWRLRLELCFRLDLSSPSLTRIRVP